VIENDPAVKRIIQSAIEEDLGSGDLTTDAIVSPGANGKATLVAREELVLAGLPVFEMVFITMSPEIETDEYYRDGDIVPAGKSVCVLQGPLSSILKGERTALNFLQRMSGIATLTRQYVQKAGFSKVKVLDTRKTVPGLRVLDKYAVRIGGGFNHRFGLFDAVLIKDNHIAVAGSITRAVELAKKNIPRTVSVEVEVEDLAGVMEAVKTGVDTILLDNMQPEEIKRAVELVKGRTVLEASGGINLDTIEDVAKTGVDFISIGALTHSARAADFSLEIITG
jgi:nicotinate-nucleotide pyrophosphorylase (carboxylating)